MLRWVEKKGFIVFIPLFPVPLFVNFLIMMEDEP